MWTCATPRSALSRPVVVVLLLILGWKRSATSFSLARPDTPLLEEVRLVHITRCGNAPSGEDVRVPWRDRSLKLPLHLDVSSDLVGDLCT